MKAIKVCIQSDTFGIQLDTIPMLNKNRVLLHGIHEARENSCEGEACGSWEILLEGVA